MRRAETRRQATLAVAISLLLKLRWLLLGVLVFSALGIMWWLNSGEPSLLIAAGQIMEMITWGVVLPFLLHETAHAVVALGGAHVTAVRIENTLLRMSVLPEGELSYARALATAVAGPGICFFAALGLLLVGQPVKALGFGIHLIFLLPWFGDGRAVAFALANLRRS